MDMFSSQHSPISDPDIPALLPAPQTLRTVKIEPMSDACRADYRPYTPNVLDTLTSSHQDILDSYGCPGSITYMSLNPTEIDVVGQSEPLFSSDLLSYDYKPTFYKLDQSDMFSNDVKDEGYVSPNRSFHSLTPPTQSYGHLTPLDSANESGNSSEYTSVRDAEDVPPLSQFQLTEPTQPHAGPRTQCVKCGCLVDVGQCLKEASGHYLCYTCRSHVQTFDHQSDVDPQVETITKRSRKRPSAEANNRNNVCANCEITHSKLWRRDFRGETVCNACGLYEKLHFKCRPKHMRKDVIQTRKRKPRSAESKKKISSPAVPPPPPKRATVAVSISASLPPPPPYDRYAATHDTSSYQLLPPMNNNDLYYPNCHFDMSYQIYPGSAQS